MKCFSCLLVFAFVFTAIAQDYEVTVTTVSVWIRATDKSGKPVTGLTSADFEVFEDGKKVEHTCFEESTSPAPQPAEAAAPGDTSVPDKQIVFLLDQANTSQAEYLNIRTKMAEFLSSLTESWNVTLVSLIPGAINIEIENSRDAQEFLSRLDRISANPTRDLDAIQKRRDISTVLKQFALGRKIPQMIEESCNIARDYAQQEKELSMQWLESLREFDRYIKKQTPESHKVVLFFSGGISSAPGKQYFEIVKNSDLVREMVAEAEWNLERDYPSCVYDEGLDLNRELEKLIGQLNRYNITFYNVSSRGPINTLLDTAPEGRQLKPSDFQFLQEYQDVLAVMAQETGGIYFGNSLNFKKGFDNITDDLSHQYLICYSPPQHKKEGHHDIEVKSKRKGVKLRHRSGYYD